MKKAIWIPALALAVTFAALTAVHLTLRAQDYSIEGRGCADLDLRPARDLFGQRRTTVVNEPSKQHRLSCGLRIMEGELGIALIIVLAETFDTPQLARAGFLKVQAANEGGHGVAGVAELAMFNAMPFSSDAPGAMTNHILIAQDRNLVLTVALQVFNYGIELDVAAVERALIDTAKRLLVQHRKGIDKLF